MKSAHDLNFHVEVNSAGDYSVTSHEPESGIVCNVSCGNIFRQSDHELFKSVGTEIMSWITLWSDEIGETEEDSNPTKQHEDDKKCTTNSAVPKEDVSDMGITVGHIVANPTFPFDGDFEITSTDEFGNVYTLYDHHTSNLRHVPTTLLVKPVTYLVVNSENGILRIEIG